MATENANLPLPPESPNCQRLNRFLVLLTTVSTVSTVLLPDRAARPDARSSARDTLIF